MNRWTIRTAAALLGAAVVAGCGPSTSGKSPAPNFDTLAAQVARNSICQSSLPLTRQLGSDLSQPAASAALAGIARGLQHLSNAAQDSLLQQRLQNLVDEIQVLRAAWSHQSARTVDVTDELRGMINGFGRTCPGH